MTLDTTKDLFYLVLSFAAGFTTIFLCWGLYELAKMVHQANAVVTDAREKLNRLERMFESSSRYLGMIADGGKSLLSFLHLSEEKKEKRRKTKKDEDDE